jgi:hypothetical protein
VWGVLVQRAIHVKSLMHICKQDLKDFSEHV